MIESAYAASQQEPSLIGFLLPIFILVLMYFILIRPQSKKLKEHKKMVAALKVGDEIATSGGIYMERSLNLQTRMQWLKFLVTQKLNYKEIQLIKYYLKIHLITWSNV